MRQQEKRFKILLVALIFLSNTAYSQLLTVKDLTGFSDVLLQPYHQNQAPFDKITFENLPNGYILTEMVNKLAIKPPHYKNYTLSISNVNSPDNEKFTFLAEENTDGYKKLITLKFSTQNFEMYKKWYNDLNNSNDITRTSPLVNALLYKYKNKAIVLSISYTTKTDTRDLTIDTTTATTPITYLLSIQYPDYTAGKAATNEYKNKGIKK